MGASKKNRRSARGMIASLVMGGETNNWFPDLSRTITSSISRTCRRRAITCRRTSPTRP
jgi:hypothetical protein